MSRLRRPLMSTVLGAVAACLAMAAAAQTQAPVAPAGPVKAALPAPGSPKPAAPRVRRAPRPLHPAPGPLATIGRANAQARDWPKAGAYVNSALFYDFEPGRIYTIHASPRFLTTIALKPGEKLISKAAGDTIRWVLGETQSGAGDGAQVIVFVKPIRADLRTNIVLTTDQRVYLVDASSTASPAYTSVLSWNYPQDQARVVAAERARLEGQANAAVAGDIALDRLDFRYRIEPVGTRPPRWQPVRVFDDGAKTYVEFPAELSTTEAPPLFLLGPKGRAELVNYRVRGGYYVVDRLIEIAELRLGEGRQTVVRISHMGSRR
jgi:P-type conjugative transfer protein TrbG